MIVVTKEIELYDMVTVFIVVFLTETNICTSIWCEKKLILVEKRMVMLKS